MVQLLLAILMALVPLIKFVL